MNKGTIVIIGITVLVVIGLGFVLANRESVAGELDGFAQCLKENEATFYGAFWCPHCQSQKRMFGSSAKLLPYVECSLPDGKTRTPICIEKGIESYPTWIFKDGSRENGEVPLATLAEKTGCQLPEGATL
jgi:thiol-disulfide isomerase/thioredoxin